MSTPHPFISGECCQGGCGHGTNNQEEILSEESSGWVAEYTQRVRVALEFGVGAVKSLLGSLASEDMWAVVLIWEEENLQEFNQFAEIVPDWFRWCRA